MHSTARAVGLRSKEVPEASQPAGACTRYTLLSARAPVRAVRTHGLLVWGIEAASRWCLARGGGGVGVLASRLLRLHTWRVLRSTVLALRLLLLAVKALSVACLLLRIPIQ